MITNGHLSQDELARIVFEPEVTRLDKTETHLRQCEACTELFALLKRTYKLSGKQQPKDSGGEPGVDAVSDYLTRIYTGKLSKQEAADYLHLLTTSQSFFKNTLNFVAESLAPVTEAEQRELQPFANLSIANEVLKAVPPIPVANIFEKIWEKLKKTGLLISRWVNKILDLLGIHNPSPALRWAFMLFLSVLVGGGGVRITTLVQNRMFLARYVYDDRVPVEYDASSLPAKFKSGSFRGTEPDETSRTQLEIFTDHLHYVLRDYNLRRYKDVIDRLQAIAMIFANLKKEATGLDEQKLVRDYNFFLGASHFALARSQKISQLEDEREQHFAAAIRNLKEAIETAKSYGLDYIDRDTYLLGMAQGFAGNKDVAVETLQTIELGSSFYERSLELIEKWK